MLSKNLKSIRSMNVNLKRCLATGQPQSKASEKIQVSTLPSGIVLASVPSQSPLTRLAVVVRAGSRFESQTKLGLTHILRSAAGFTTERYTGFGITRNIEYFGGSLTVAGNRDTLSYLLEVHNDEDTFSRNFAMLSDTISKPAFKQWEISDNLERIKADISVLDDTPFIQLAEALHSAAFKGGLRNSLYSPKFMIGKHTTEDLLEFHRNHFIGSNTAIVGVGLEHEQLVELVSSNILLNSGSQAKDSSKFIGGQVHIESSSPLTYVALACEGVGLKNSKDAVALALLQKILGAGSQIKNSNGLSQVGRLGRAVSASLSGKSPANVAVSAFNFNYEETGLFGINLIAPSGYDVTGLTKAAVKEFRATASSATEEELKSAKNNLKTSALITLDDSATYANELGAQLLLAGKPISIDEFNKTVDSVTTGDLKNLGTRLLKSKAALATVGVNAPYLDDLVE